MNETINLALKRLAIDEAPVIIKYLTDKWAASHPKEPPPTSEQVIDAWHQALASSKAVDEDWLAAHPRKAGQ
jgi:hypothetical protein